MLKKKFTAAFAALLAFAQVTSPALAGNDKPVVTISGGAVRPLPAGDTVVFNPEGIILPHGSAPPSPSNGACWTTTAGLFCRINGFTVGPYGSGGGGGSGTVSAVSVTTANGVSGSVATSTTTPAISLSLGAITPTSVAASGTITGSNLSGSNTGDQDLSSYATTAALALKANKSVPVFTAAGTDLLRIERGGYGGNSVTFRAIDNAGFTFGQDAGSDNWTTIRQAGVFVTGTVDASGAVTGSNLSGTNTGDQSLAGLQPLDSDLTSVAALATTTYGRSQLTLADAAADTAQLNVFTSALKGLAPASGGGTTNFLRADGAWAAPPGGGGSGTVTSVTLTQPAAGITLTNSGVSQTTAATSTVALANDLAAVEGLATTGLVRRTGTDAWSAGTAVALTELATQAANTFVANGTGGSAAPTAVSATSATALLDAATGSLKGLMSSADFTKLSGVATGATANSSDATLLARANHTGTQAPSTISTAAGSVLVGRYAATSGAGQEITVGTGLALNTSTGVLSNTVTDTNSGGTVTAVSVATANGVSGSSSGGATPALTIALGAITPTSVAASGTVTGSNLSGSNTGDQNLAPYATLASPTFTGTVTLPAGTVTLANQANMATSSLVYRKTAGAGAPEVNTLATLKTDLGLTGTNSGDQSSIVGITGTTAQFNTALTDGDFATGGGTATGTNTGDQTITLTGNVTGSGTGSFAATIANSAVTLAKMADVATSTVFYRKTAATGAPEVQTLATLKTDLGLTGTNSGDQTSVTGNAGTATALATGRTIAMTGDVAWTSPSFDGTGNVTAAGTLATVNSNTGSFGSATQVGTFTVNGKGLITAAGNTNVTPAVGSITGLGTGVATALAVNVGTAGAPVVLNGALGTPSSGTLTNATGLPESGVTSLVSDLAAKQPLDTQLTDLAALAYASNGLKVLRVNSGATGWELVTISAGGGDVLASNNLSELTDYPTARTNLGLGTAAVKNTGTSGNTVPLLDGSNTWSASQTITLADSAAITPFSIIGGRAIIQIFKDNTPSKGGALGSMVPGGALSDDLIFSAWSGAAWAESARIVNATKALTVVGPVTGSNLSGTNTGDQASIVGITGTLAQFNTAVTDADLAPIAAPTFTGDAQAVTAAANDNDTSVATTAFVTTAVAPKAPIANPVFTGVMAWQQGSPPNKAASATLTGAEVLGGMMTTSGTTAVALTLPTGTNMDTAATTQFGAALANDRMWDWYTINTGTSSGAVTMTAGTAHTIVGNAVCAIATTCHWGTRKTATNTYVTYRLG